MKTVLKRKTVKKRKTVRKDYIKTYKTGRPVTSGRGKGKQRGAGFGSLKPHDIKKRERFFGLGFPVDNVINLFTPQDRELRASGAARTKSSPEYRRILEMRRSLSDTMNVLADSLYEPTLIFEGIKSKRGTPYKGQTPYFIPKITLFEREQRRAKTLKRRKTVMTSVMSDKSPWAGYLSGEAFKPKESESLGLWADILREWGIPWPTFLSVPTEAEALGALKSAYEKGRVGKLPPSKKYRDKVLTLRRLSPPTFEPSNVLGTSAIPITSKSIDLSARRRKLKRRKRVAKGYYLGN